MTNTTRMFSRRQLLKHSLATLTVATTGCVSRTSNRVDMNGQNQSTTTETTTPQRERSKNGRPDTSGMDLAFQDSFGRAPLDTSRWNTIYPWNSRVHNYNGYADPNNVYVYGDSLVIEAMDKPQEGKRFTTGVATSKTRFGPGYFEAAVKTSPPFTGFWPALWLAPGYKWPPEIDIFEVFGSDDTPTATYHYVDGNGRTQEVSKTFSGSRFSTDYHVYGLDWQSDCIVWYLDGTEQFRYEGDFVTDDEMFLIFNFGIDAPFLGSPDPDTLPAVLEMDWVRIWQR